jgi:hypothetical protein
MSKNLPEKQNPEEVDLGQLFKLIGNAFSRFFNFIGNIFHKLFLAFVWLVFFVKKHIIKFIITAILGYAYGFVKERTLETIYKSSIVIKQNYRTGENLNSVVNQYNNLISEKDSIALSSALQITPKEANSLKGFSIESILDENQKLRLFDNYTKSIDSVLATTIDFKTFTEKGNAYDDQFQRITLKSMSKNVFNKAFNKLVENVETIKFFINEQKKDLSELTRREDIIRESLKESDSLQKVYQIVLEKSVEQIPGSQTTVTIDNTEDKSKTKEYELFNKDLELRRELVTIAREKENLSDIIEIISTEQNEGILDNSKEVFGISFSQKIFFGLLLTLIAFVVLLSLEFLKYLERFKDKV